MSYYYSTFHDKKIRIENDNTAFVKEKNKDEYEVDRRGNLVTDTMIEANEITEDEYNSDT